MKEIVFLAGAQADFDAAFDWYAARSESAAIRFSDEIHGCLDRVARDPERFASVETVNHQARVKRFPYRLVFQVQGDHVTVVAIAHHSRRPEYWRRPPGI
ncbi:MAG: type II toxin-antitoxin system RelE/ParE family toxin [Pirellulales bacterium]